MTIYPPYAATAAYTTTATSYTENEIFDGVCTSSMLSNNKILLYTPTNTITDEIYSSVHKRVTHSDIPYRNSSVYENTIKITFKGSLLKYTYEQDYPYKPLSATERLRQVIRSRIPPAAPRKELDRREIRARETLRLLVGEREYRRYVTRSFVTIQGTSGRIYQIFPGHGFTRILEKGKCVERACVVLSGNFPPTDAVIMRVLLIQNDENDFLNRAIKHGPGPTITCRRTERPVESEHTSLVDLIKQLRAA